LKVISSKLRLEGNFDFHKLAKLTPGFVGADLAALSKEAAAVCINRIFNQIEATTSQNNKSTQQNTILSNEKENTKLTIPNNEPLNNLPPLSLDQISGLAITMSDFEQVLNK
jgi:ribosome biogenesis ATPase